MAGESRAQAQLACALALPAAVRVSESIDVEGRDVDRTPASSASAIAPPTGAPSSRTSSSEERAGRDRAARDRPAPGRRRFEPLLAPLLRGPARLGARARARARRGGRCRPGSRVLAPPALLPGPCRGHTCRARYAVARARGGARRSRAAPRPPGTRPGRPRAPARPARRRRPRRPAAPPHGDRLDDLAERHANGSCTLVETWRRPRGSSVMPIARTPGRPPRLAHLGRDRLATRHPPCRARR